MTIPPTYSIVGSGNVGSALARIFARAHVDVTIANTRGPESLRELTSELGPTVQAASITDAIEVPSAHGKRVVIVSSNSDAASGVIAQLARDLGFAPIELGRIDEGGRLIQAQNALVLRPLIGQRTPTTN